MNHTASKRLQWRTHYEAHYGDTPDISVFRFEFWEPIFYHDPHAKFPQPNLLPGRFLGIARTTGDTFTFYVYTQKPKGRNSVLARSVIRRRFPDDPKAQSDYREIGDSAIAIHTTDTNQNNESLGTTDPFGRTPDTRDPGIRTDDLPEPQDQDHNQLQQTYAQTLHRRDIVNDVTCLTEDTEVPKDELLQRILDTDPEEIVIGEATGTYQGRDEETGDHILHMEDGEYKQINTAELYNHLAQDTKPEGIERLL